MELFVVPKIKRWLAHTSTQGLTVFATVTAFCLYTCLFALRKSFTAATFGGITFLNIDYKAWLILSQVLGYLLSKFIGIKVISELKPDKRAFGILIIAICAVASWLAFALVPKPYNILFLFFNGLPLGMGWGLMIGYLEGRKTTDVMAAGLSVSFIFSSGFSRTIGSMIMNDWNLSPFWMPFVAALVFFVPLLLFLFLINHLPPPNAEDERLRTKRKPMMGLERWNFFKVFAPGLVLLILLYVLLTTFRDLRDNFSAEIWEALGYGKSSQIYTVTEAPVSLIVLIVIGSLMFIRSNFLAFMIIHVIVLIGLLTVGISTLGFQQQWVSAPVWMILVGVGLYFGYIAFNSVLFDRLIATYKYASTVGFLIYLADSCGYIGSAAVVFYKNLGQPNLSWLEFFTGAAYAMSVIGSLLIVASMVYFYWKYKQAKG